MIAELVLTAALAAWQADIEAKAGLPLIAAQVEHRAESNEFSLAEGTPRRAAFVQYLKDEAFMRQFAQTFGVMVHHKGEDAAYLVMLNGAKLSQWGAHSEALLGHEFGHAWVKAEGYPTPVFIPNKWACVGVHAGDITQHVLIRAEMDRRGIAFRPFWLEGLESATVAMETGSAPPADDRCSRLRVAAELIDVRLGLAAGEWAGRARYEKAVAGYMPEILATAGEIVDYMGKKEMNDRGQHREALRYVFEKLKDLAYQRTKADRVYVNLRENPNVG